MRHGAICQRFVDRRQCAQQIHDEAGLHNGAARLPFVGRFGLCRQDTDERGRGVTQQRGMFGGGSGGAGQQIGARGEGRCARCADDTLDRRNSSLARQQAERVQQCPVVGFLIDAGRCDAGDECFDAGDVVQSRQGREHARRISGCFGLPRVPARFRPLCDHVSGKLVRIAVQRRAGVRTVRRPALHHIFQERQRCGETGLTEHRECPILWPNHQGRAAIGALEGSTRVAGGFLEMDFVGFEFCERVLQRKFTVIDRDLAERRRAAIEPAPLRQRRGPVADFGGLEPVVVVIVVVMTAAVSRIAGIIRRTGLLPCQQGKMQLAAGPA